MSGPLKKCVNHYVYLCLSKFNLLIDSKVLSYQINIYKYKCFSSCWEVRHGACIGLREILKIHGHGAGRVGMLKKRNYFNML